MKDVARTGSKRIGDIYATKRSQPMLQFLKWEPEQADLPNGVEFVNYTSFANVVKIG